MVLETRYKHLRHQMKSVPECSKHIHLTNMPRQTMLDAHFTCDIMGSCELYGGNWVQVCVRAFEEAAAALDLSFSLRDGSCFAQTAGGALTFTRAKPVADWWFFLFLVYLIGAPHDVGRHDVSKPVLSPDTPPIFRSEVTAESCVEANHKK